MIAVLAVVIAGAGPAASATHSTRDGHTIVLNAAGHRVRSVAPLDGSPLSREGFELSVSNALGAVSVRPYAKISVTTDTGVYVYSTYGTIKKL